MDLKRFSNGPAESAVLCRRKFSLVELLITIAIITTQ